MRSAIRSSNRQFSPTSADQRFARNRFCRGEDRGFDAQHPFPPARGRRQVEKLHVERVVALASAAAGGGAHRP